MKSKLLIVSVFLFYGIAQVVAQDTKLLLKTGDKNLRNRHYRKALPFFEQVLKTEPENTEALYKAGICHLNRYSKEKALSDFQKVYKQDSLYNRSLYYWLGRAHHQNYNFSEALTFYSMYKTKIAKWDTRQKEMDFYIDQVKRARDYVSNPQNYIVKNLGPVINTSYSEHSPVTSINDTTILFTSRRDKVSGTKEDFDGEPFEDIFTSSRNAAGAWSEPVLFRLNTTGHDASVQLFDNDTKLFVYRYLKGGDIYLTEKTNGEWSTPKRFANINTRDFESDAFMTADGNTVYYATNHYKKNGDLDIYYITKKSDNSWNKPKQLKGRINSDEDEDAPFITADGKTMYFSSRGHSGMGGYDVYKSVLDESGKWSKPENLGYPINTADDDVYYYRSSVTNKAYMSSYRDGGYGEKDLYEIISIESVEIKGLVLEDKTNNVIGSGTITFIPLETSSKNAASATSIVNASGTYTVPLLSSNNYKVIITSGKDTLAVDSLNVPLYEEKGSVLAKNYYIPFKGILKDTTVKDTIVKEPVKEVVVAPKRTGVVYFASKSSDLGPASKSKLADLVDFMKTNAGSIAVIQGYTDAEGNEGTNMELSGARADKVRDYLLSKGISSSRIKTESFGAQKPVSSNDSEEGRSKNRRVEITIE